MIILTIVVILICVAAYRIVMGILIATGYFTYKSITDNHPDQKSKMDENDQPVENQPEPEHKIHIGLYGWITIIFLVLLIGGSIIQYAYEWIMRII